MATKTKTYQQYIEAMKQAGISAGKDYIIISARALHKQLSASMPTVPTCCNAMKSMMLEGDSYIQNPKVASGHSINLVIRYELHNLEERAHINLPKKRGRKNGINGTLEQWLTANAWSYKKKADNYEVLTSKGTWLIYVTKKGYSLEHVFFRIFFKESKDCYKLSILTKNNDGIKIWDRIKKTIIMKLEFSLLVIDEKNNIIEYEDGLGKKERLENCKVLKKYDSKDCKPRVL